ncbi:Rhs element vgr protein [Seminavis robusta]|uniref:Rhs element vgr protein n=1 Tax=Seminavis robusta TaxID=568900 RepID=A0A9N8H9K3_9STRA|nr:Rhs element vgr protein [Seminavis robusta]|eukprot:Sro258_g101050.1 Rhs element vgr protein (826) ;mRNA; f:11714-14191
MWRLNEEATRNLVKPWRKKKASLFFITLAVLALVLILDLALAPHPRLHVQSLKVDVSEPVPLAIAELDLKQGSFFSRLEPRGVHCSLEPRPQDDETENITAVIDIDVRLEKKDNLYRLVASPDEEDVDPFADILWKSMTRQDKSSILETVVCSFKVKVHVAHLIPIPITRKVELSEELVDKLLNSQAEREKMRVRVISTENNVNATGESTASPVRFDALKLGLSIPTPAFADSATIVLPELTATVQPNNVSGWKVHMEETEYMFSTQGDGIALAITCNSPDCPWFQPLIDLYFHRASKIMLSVQTSKASFLEAMLGSQHQFSVDFEKKPLPTIPSRFLQLANISLPPYIPPIPPVPCAPIPASFNATSITYNSSCTENPSSPNITRTPRPTNLPTPMPTNLPTPMPSYAPTYMPWDIPTPHADRTWISHVHHQHHSNPSIPTPSNSPTPPTPPPTPLPTPPPTPLPTPPPSNSPTPMTSRPTPSPTPVPDSDELAECMALTSDNDSSAFQYDLCFLLEPSKGMSLVSKVEVYDYIGGAHASSTWESISWERVQVETKARIALNSDNDTINLQGTFLFDIRDDTNLQLDADFVNDGSWWPFVVSLNWNGYYAGNVLRMSMSNGQVQLVGEQDLLTNAVGSAILDIDQQTFESTVADTQVQFDAGGWIMGEQSVSGSSSLVVKGDTIWNAVVDGKLQVNAYDDWMASMELMDQKLQVALDGQLQQQDLAASSMCKFNGKVIWNTILQGMVRAANRELAITAEAIDEAQMLQLSTDIVASDYSRDLSLAATTESAAFGKHAVFLLVFDVFFLLSFFSLFLIFFFICLF